MDFTPITKTLREDAAKLIQAADILEGTPVQRTPVQRTTSQSAKPVKRHMSAAARRRISIAQRARWAVYRGGKKAA